MGKSIKVVNLLIVSLLIPIILLYLVFFTSSLLPFIVCFGIVMLISRSKFVKKYPIIYRKRIIILSYLIISLVGLLFVINYYSLYGFTFGPYWDDSMYFYNIADLATGETLYKTPTLYEISLVPWYKFVSLFKTDITSLDILPVNWIFSSLVVTLSLMLTRLVVKQRFKLLLPFLAIIGNSIFLDSVANLYRDGFALLLFLGTLVSGMNGKFKTALLFSILCSGVRLATGGIAILGLIWLYYLKKIHQGGFKKIILVPTAIIVLVLVVDMQFPLGDYMRSLLAGGDSSVTIVEVALERANRFVESGSEGSTIDRIYRLGPIGYLLAPIATIFAPVEFISPIKNFIVDIRKQSSFSVSGLYPRALWGWITTILWAIIGPRLVLGIYKSRKGNKFEKLFLLLFLLTVLAVTFISFQTRHRTTFIVLFPMFVAISEKYISGNRLIIIISLIFIGGITLFNLMKGF